MMTAILIDDELPALTILDYYLTISGEVTVIGKYSEPYEGIEAVAALKPQAVFLDIDMPEITGIAAAAFIAERSPGTEIIFVTAYSEYAVQAFEISALDYLLKPISRGRLEKTIARIKDSIALKGTASGRRLKIRCLGGFSIGWEGEEPIKWRSKKIQEVIAFLIQNKGKVTGSEILLDAIWPDADQENASHKLRNAVYYARKALSDYGVTDKEISIQGRYCLTVGDADLDVDVFRRRCARIQAGADLQNYIDCVNLYAGEYLSNTGWLWAEQEKATLQRYFLRAVSQAARQLTQRLDYVAAEEYLLKGLAKEPYEESLVLQLLDLYGRTGERVKAAHLYQAYANMMTAELGCQPSREVTEKFRGTA